MSSQKRNNNGSGSSGGSGGSANKKARTDDQPDFLSDGLDNKAICDIVQDIMIILHDNKGKTPHADIVNNISREDKFKFFIERYPMLFDMVTKEAGFDYSSLEYFLSMRDEIIKQRITSEEASKQVGQVWFDKYYKPPA
jgi:hypothetical protein